MSTLTEPCLDAVAVQLGPVYEPMVVFAAAISVIVSPCAASRTTACRAERGGRDLDLAVIWAGEPS